MVTVNGFSRIFAGNLFPASGEYAIDANHSFAEFMVQHIVVGQVWGRFDSISGIIHIAEDPLMSSIDISIDPASISTHNPDRDKDLRSPRYFNVEKYPKISFLSSLIKTAPGGRFAVDGNLNICDRINVVSLNAAFNGIVEDPWGKIRTAFQAKTRINRKDFGLLTDLPRESGGLLVSKDVKIKIAVEALLKK
jgi:polyisoprenoid-binding protein YceI